MNKIKTSSTILFFFLLLFFSFIPPVLFPFKIGKIFQDPRIWILLSAVITLAIPAIRKVSFWEFVEKIDHKLKSQKWILFLASFYLLAQFLTNKILALYAITPSGADFSHFDYAVWNTARFGNLLEISIIESNSYYLSLLGNHFSPILLIMVPFYYLIESHLWPQIFQAFAAWSGVILIFYFARYFLQKTKAGLIHISSFLIAASLASNDFFIRVLKYEFHHEIFYIPLMIWLVFELDTFFTRSSNKSNWKNITRLTIAFISTLLVKEDSGLFLAGLGVSWFFMAKGKKNKIISTTFVVICLFYFFTCYKVIIPYFKITEGNSYIGFWGRYGNSLGEIIASVLTQPYLVVWDFITAKAFYKMYLPWLFLPFTHLMAIAALPGLIIHFCAQGMLRELLLYYSAPIIPLVVIAFIYALSKIKNAKTLFVLILISFLLNLSLGVGSYRLPSPAKNVFQVRDELARNLNKIPVTDKKIFISGHLLAQTDYRQDFRRIWSNNFYNSDYDLIRYIIIGKNVNTYPLSQGRVRKLINDLNTDKRFQAIFKGQEIIIFERL